MLDNGFSLAKVELLNWGNFHGYQKFSLHAPSEGGPLFASPPASAILGINGSGKSTLIDALMIALLPFEGSLKLGVTNDVEAGTGGGRTIRDYVLGKHSSHNGIVSDPETVYGRKEGCSFVLLHFVHNRNPERTLTLGRGWWYQNHKVSDTQLAFLSYEAFPLTNLCPAGKTPATPKAFRQHLKIVAPNVHLFETMQVYFTALSQALGRISRDDLKILNRAFFVKSISNIDQFIRENMLTEQENPNLDRLMENVRNGQEIAFSIETCEAKISAIARIIRELSKLQELAEISKSIDQRLRLLSLHREWTDLRNLLKQQADLRREIHELEARLPVIRKDAEVASERWRAAQSRLVSDDIEARLSSLDLQTKTIAETIVRKEAQLSQWQEKAKKFEIKLPKTGAAWERFLHDVVAQVTSLQSERTALSAEIEDLREKKFSVEASARTAREELQHFSDNRTLIPRDLFEIKVRAMRALKIAPTSLVFVGELIQIKRDCVADRRAVESVLFPISRNLLCHPNHLQDLTRWLDAEGLRADLTAKRITDEELGTMTGDRDLQKEPLLQASVLRKIELRDPADHPFTNYVWRWLLATFDYQLVDLKQFRGQSGKLVTQEGLVKKDPRTLRKLKQNFPFSLGWDNTEMIAVLTADLLRLNQENTRLASQLNLLLKKHEISETKERFLVELQQRYLEVADLESEASRIKELEQERIALLQKNPDHSELRNLVEELNSKANGLTKGLLRVESELTSRSELLEKVERVIPGQEKELTNSSLFQGLQAEFGGIEVLEQALAELDSTLSRQAISRLQMESDLTEEVKKIDASRGRAISMTAANLGNYRHQFNDPNMPYDLGSNFSPEHFLSEWSNAERRLKETELPSAQEKWKRFFDRILLDSVKDMINEIKSKLHEIELTVRSINEVLKLTNFEDLATEQRYLRIDAQATPDERIRKFRKYMGEIEKTLSPGMRSNIETQSQVVMAVLAGFVDELQKDPSYRAYATDVRNHFQFGVQSLRRGNAPSEADVVVETFSGSKKDAKSSAQTTQLAYALLASCLAYRFHFHDPVRGAETPRFIILDEFGGKFDNEKPREILKLLEKMGFQSILVSPMSKADLLADGISHLVLVHKVSAARSKVQSYQLSSREDYERLLANGAAAKELGGLP